MNFQVGALFDSGLLRGVNQTPKRQTDPTLLTEKSPGIFSPPRTEVAPMFDLPNYDTSITESVDAGEHTLTAFGDISITNVFFVPGLSSGISPAQSAAHTPKRTAARLRPKGSPFRANVRYLVTFIIYIL